MSDAIAVRSLVAGSLRRQVTRLSLTGTERAGDAVSIEEPLEIRLSHMDGQSRSEQSIAITMRTPGQDEALAIGFLAGEAIIRHGGRYSKHKTLRAAEPGQGPAKYPSRRA